MLLVPSGDLVYCMFWVGVKIFTFNTIENSGKYSNIKIKSDTLENVLVMIGVMMFLKGFSREEPISSGWQACSLLFLLL